MLYQLSYAHRGNLYYSTQHSGAGRGAPARGPAGESKKGARVRESRVESGELRTLNAKLQTRNAELPSRISQPEARHYELLLGKGIGSAGESCLRILTRA